MYLERKYQGDHGSVGEELMTNISKLEEMGATVEKAVKEGYFNLQDALSIYRLSEIEYVVYQLRNIVHDSPLTDEDIISA